MPTRIPVPPPAQDEEVRLLAETLADLEEFVSVILEHRDELLPGEAAGELAASWVHARLSFQRLVQAILDAGQRRPRSGDAPRSITPQALEEHQLLGEVGKAKRSWFARLRDGFYMFWNSAPRTDEKRQKAAGAAQAVLECGASIAGSIPGGGIVEEALLLIKQAVGLRASRGH